MSEEFVPASRLYDVESRMAFPHPAQQATDTEIHQAVGGGERTIEHEGKDTLTIQEQRNRAYLRSLA